MLQEHDLEDVPRSRANRDTLRFTHFQKSSNARLDRIYMSAEVITNISSYVVKPLFFTVHCLVTVTLGNYKQPKNKFSWHLWKMNNRLLDDAVFVESVIETLKKIATGKKKKSFLEKWEYFKEEVKQMAIERSSYLKYVSRKTEKELQKYWHELFENENKIETRAQTWQKGTN